MAEVKKPTSRYAIKKRHGVEVNHDRHPQAGVADCDLCSSERRPNTFRVETACYTCINKEGCMLPIPQVNWYTGAVD